METLKDIIQEVCSIGCGACSFNPTSPQCAKQREDYEKRARKAVIKEITIKLEENK